VAAPVAKENGGGGKNTQGMLGLGVDVVAVSRWRRLWRSYGGRLAGRVFAPEELAECRGRHAPEQLAARWAGKEAVAKALGCRPGPWRDVVIQRGPDGVPRVLLRGAWMRAARERGIRCWHISLSHEKAVAVAVAVALTGDERAGAAGVGPAHGTAAVRPGLHAVDGDAHAGVRPAGGGAVQET